MTVDAVSNSQVFRGNRHSHVLTLVEAAGSGDSRYKDNAIDAFTDLQTVYCRPDVEVRIFTANYADIFA